MNKALVLVRYGALNNTLKYNYFLKFINKINYKLIDVDTKSNEQKRYYSLNEAFEFSGFRAGIERAIKPGQNSVIFINDTFFKSHFFFYGLYIILLFDKCEYLRNSIQGILCKSIIGSYFSTWIFMIQTDDESFKNLSLYDYDLPFGRFFKEKYDLLNAEFKKYIFQWLIPKSIFKGWYKNNPYKFLNINEYKRKIYTIHCEYSMYNRFQKLGFHVIPINLNIFCRLLGYIDRSKLILIKIYSRTMTR